MIKILKLNLGVIIKMSEDKDEDWYGYQFENYYTDSLTRNEKQLNSVFVKYEGIKMIVICDDKWWGDKKLYYYIKVPKKGLTYKNLYKQLDTQSKQYKTILDNDDHRFIEAITKKTDIEYDMWCGS